MGYLGGGEIPGDKAGAWDMLRLFIVLVHSLYGCARSPGADESHRAIGYWRR